MPDTEDVDHMFLVSAEADAIYQEALQGNIIVADDDLEKSENSPTNVAQT